MFLYVDADFVQDVKARLRKGELAGTRDRLLADAVRWMNKGPWSVTHYPSPAVSGNPHDYFSEGTYWWPNPDDPTGPYIRRDGEANPNRFTAWV